MAGYMKQVRDPFPMFLRGEDGQSLIEYSLIASIVAIGSVMAIWLMKEQLLSLIYGVLALY